MTLAVRPENVQQEQPQQEQQAPDEQAPDEQAPDEQQGGSGIPDGLTPDQLWEWFQQQGQG